MGQTQRPWVRQNPSSCLTQCQTEKNSFRQLCSRRGCQVKKPKAPLCGPQWGHAWRTPCFLNVKDYGTFVDFSIIFIFLNLFSTGHDNPLKCTGVYTKTEEVSHIKCNGMYRKNNQKTLPALRLGLLNTDCFKQTLRLSY